jgi:hypothetical protein
MAQRYSAPIIIQEFRSAELTAVPFFANFELGLRWCDSNMGVVMASLNEIKDLRQKAMEFAKRAEKAGCHTLKYLFDMAASEADIQIIKIHYRERKQNRGVTKLRRIS